MFVDFFDDLIGLQRHGSATIVEHEHLLADERVTVPLLEMLTRQGGRRPERWVAVQVHEAYIHCSSISADGQDGPSGRLGHRRRPAQGRTTSVSPRARACPAAPTPGPGSAGTPRPTPDAASGHLATSTGPAHGLGVPGGDRDPVLNPGGDDRGTPAACTRCATRSRGRVRRSTTSTAIRHDRNDFQPEQPRHRAGRRCRAEGKAPCPAGVGRRRGRGRGKVIPSLGAELVRAVGIHAGQRVLDVAAGSGNASIPAAQAGAAVTASYSYPRAVRRRAGRGRGGRGRAGLVEADAEALPFATAEFDAVISCVGVMFAPHHQQYAQRVHQQQHSAAKNAALPSSRRSKKKNWLFGELEGCSAGRNMLVDACRNLGKAVAASVDIDEEGRRPRRRLRDVLMRPRPVRRPGSRPGRAGYGASLHFVLEGLRRQGEGLRRRSDMERPNELRRPT